MAKWTRRGRLKMRQLLVGAALFSAGVFAALAGVQMYERAQEVRTVAPLTPGSGEAKSQLIVAWLPATVIRWKPQIEKYANEYGIDPNLIAIIMTVESGGDPRANSGVAKGLMQITDPTAGDIARKHLNAPRDTYDLYDPTTSIEFGAAYLRYLTNEVGRSAQGPSWDETVALVSAGYNGGLTASYAYRDRSWKGLEGYDMQTLNYARYVRTMWQERRDPLSFAYRYWYDQANGKRLVEAAEKYQKAS